MTFPHTAGLLTKRCKPESIMPFSSLTSAATGSSGHIQSTMRKRWDEPVDNSILTDGKQSGSTRTGCAPCVC